MIPKREHGKHNIYNISYHIVWIPKYRKHLLRGKIKETLIKLLFKKANEIDITIGAYEIMSDHVHLFIKSKPILSVPYIVKSLKGYTSFELRKQYPSLKKYKSLWTHSYYCETIGLISENTVKKYIQMQKHKN